MSGRVEGIFEEDSSRLSPNLEDSRRAALGLPLSALRLVGGDVGGDTGEAFFSFSSAPDCDRNRDLKPSFANRPRVSSDEPSPGYDGGVMTSCVFVVVRTKVNSGTG